MIKHKFDFSLSLPRRVLFRDGCFKEAPDVVSSYGRRILCIVSKTISSRCPQWKSFIPSCKERGAEVLLYKTTGREPEADDVDAIGADACRWKPDVVCGCGGGSAIDTAKALAALIPNLKGRTTADFMEGAAEKKARIQTAPLPFVAIPTTSGTGSEATRNAVISLSGKKLKRSIRDERMVARAAVIDPGLTVTLPPQMTAFSGMDALTQLIESFISRRANPFTDALGIHALPLAFEALPRAFQDGTDKEARTALSYAAFASGVCLGNAGLGAAHAVAPALGILYGIPHGKACAALLPFALRVNSNAAAPKLAAIQRSLGGKTVEEHEAVSGLIERVENLCCRFDIPVRLSSFGVTKKDLPELCSFASGNSLRGNPRELTRKHLAELLEPFV